MKVNAAARALNAASDSLSGDVTRQQERDRLNRSTLLRSLKESEVKSSSSKDVPLDQRLKDLRRREFMMNQLNANASKDLDQKFSEARSAESQRKPDRDKAKLIKNEILKEASQKLLNEEQTLAERSAAMSRLHKEMGLSGNDLQAQIVKEMRKQQQLEYAKISKDLEDKKISVEMVRKKFQKLKGAYKDVLLKKDSELTNKQKLAFEKAAKEAKEKIQREILRDKKLLTKSEIKNREKESSSNSQKALKKLYRDGRPEKELSKIDNSDIKTAIDSVISRDITELERALNADKEKTNSIIEEVLVVEEDEILESVLERQIRDMAQKESLENAQYSEISDRFSELEAEEDPIRRMELMKEIVEEVLSTDDKPVTFDNPEEAIIGFIDKFYREDGERSPDDMKKARDMILGRLEEKNEEAKHKVKKIEDLEREFDAINADNSLTPKEKAEKLESLMEEKLDKESLVARDMKVEFGAKLTDVLLSDPDFGLKAANPLLGSGSQDKKDIDYSLKSSLEIQQKTFEGKAKIAKLNLKMKEFEKSKLDPIKDKAKIQEIDSEIRELENEGHKYERQKSDIETELRRFNE